MDGGDDGFLLCPAAPLERRAGDYFGRRRRRRRRPATVRAGQDRSHESLTFPSKSNIPPWNTRRACGKKGRYLFVFHFCVCRAVSLLFLFFQIVFSRPGLFFKTFALSLPVPTIFLTSLVSFSRRLLLSIPYPPHTLSLSSRRRIEREKKIQTHLFPPFFYQCGLAIFLGRLCGIRCVCWSFFWIEIVLLLRHDDDDDDDDNDDDDDDDDGSNFSSRRVGPRARERPRLCLPSVTRTGRGALHKAAVIAIVDSMAVPVPSSSSAAAAAAAAVAGPRRSDRFPLMTDLFLSLSAAMVEP